MAQLLLWFIFNKSNLYDMESKICNKCQKTQTIECFYKGKVYKGKQYYLGLCKKCSREKHEEYLDRCKKRIKPIITDKKCTKCNNIYLIKEFYPLLSQKDGYSNWCRNCIRLYQREYNEKIMNSPKHKVDEKVCPSCKILKPAEDFYLSVVRLDGLNRVCKQCRRKSYRKNWPKNRAKETARARERRKKDPTLKLVDALRTRLRTSIRRQSKSAHTMDLLGCTGAECMDHLEKLFWPGMTRKNYGRNGWVVDHIIPIGVFDKTDPNWQYKCFHYTNLQPLWYADNNSKKARLNWSPKESKYELPERLKIKGNL